MDAIELIFFPYDLESSSSQDVFHGGAVKFCEIFVLLDTREESFLECVDRNLWIAEGDGDLLLIEASNIVTEWLVATL